MLWGCGALQIEMAEGAAALDLSSFMEQRVAVCAHTPATEVTDAREINPNDGQPRYHLYEGTLTSIDGYFNTCLTGATQSSFVANRSAPAAPPSTAAFVRGSNVLFVAIP